MGLARFGARIRADWGWVETVEALTSSCGPKLEPDRQLTANGRDCRVKLAVWLWRAKGRWKQSSEASFWIVGRFWAPNLNMFCSAYWGRAAEPRNNRLRLENYKKYEKKFKKSLLYKPGIMEGLRQFQRVHQQLQGLVLVLAALLYVYVVLRRKFHTVGSLVHADYSPQGSERVSSFVWLFPTFFGIFIIW